MCTLSLVKKTKKNFGRYYIFKTGTLICNVDSNIIIIYTEKFPV